jgi:hypothetical protein
MMAHLAELALPKQPDMLTAAGFSAAKARLLAP